jgi:hypothetical protein
MNVMVQKLHAIPIRYNDFSSQTFQLSVFRTARLPDFLTRRLSVFRTPDSLFINQPPRNRLVRIDPAVAQKRPVGAVGVGLTKIEFLHMHFFVIM